MVCFGYIIVNTLPKGKNKDNDDNNDDDEDDDNNNNNNNNNVIKKEAEKMFKHKGRTI
jgi:hypothetical protein